MSLQLAVGIFSFSAPSDGEEREEGLRRDGRGEVVSSPASSSAAAAAVVVLRRQAGVADRLPEEHATLPAQLQHLGVVLAQSKSPAQGLVQLLPLLRIVHGMDSLR